MDCAHKHPITGTLCGLHAQDGTPYCRRHQAQHSRGAFLVDELPEVDPEVMERARTTKAMPGLPFRIIESPAVPPGTAILTNEQGKVLGRITNIGPGEQAGMAETTINVNEPAKIQGAIHIGPEMPQAAIDARGWNS